MQLRKLLSFIRMKTIVYIISLLIAINVLIVFFSIRNDNYKLISYYTTVFQKKWSDSNPTLTRIGSVLDFNYSTCPRNSVMLKPASLNANHYMMIVQKYSLLVLAKEEPPRYINTFLSILILKGFY